MKYVIIGALGQLGQEFGKILSAGEMIPLDIDDLDIADDASLRKAVSPLDFDVILNLAAFHNVGQCEEEPDSAFAVNAKGAFHVARLAREMGTKVVFFSSDYVFGGETERSTPYLESDRPAPLSVYGTSKVAGEHLVRAMAPGRHLIVRSSSLFGCVTSKKGWTFPELMLNKARAGEDLKVVADQFMAPTYTYDLATRVIELLERDVVGTCHVSNSGQCSWHEFACATLEAVGNEAGIAAVSADEFPAKARRPAYSVLGSGRYEEVGLPPMRHWRDALGAYLVEKGELQEEG